MFVRFTACDGDISLNLKTANNALENVAFPRVDHEVDTFASSSEFHNKVKELILLAYELFQNHGCEIDLVLAHPNYSKEETTAALESMRFKIKTMISCPRSMLKNEAYTRKCR